LWIGPIHLCRDSVATASRLRDPDGSPALLVTMAPAAQKRFAQLTAERVGGTLAIRLDGRILSEPLINEPILRGRAQISGMSGDVKAAARAARGPC
jgi:preprotein translocase subunit SecD